MTRRPAPLTPAELEDFAERAAIVEYLGNVPRGEAERRAMDLILANRQRAERAERFGVRGERCRGGGVTHGEGC